MAQPALEKFTRRGIALVEQLVEGTETAPNVATNGLRLYDGSSGTEFDEFSEPVDRPFFTGDAFAVTNERAFIQGNFRLYPPTTPGDATDGTPDCDVILRPGGMTKVLDAGGGTTRYNPISQSIPVTTAYWWHAGTHLRVYDARHVISALIMQTGQRYQGQVRIQGSYDEMREEQLPSITIPSALGPIIASSNSKARVTALPGGSELAVWAKSLNIDFGSDLKSKEYTEYKANTIDDRKASWSMRLARTAKADFDPWALRKAGTFIQASMRVVSADNRYVEQGIRGQIRDINPVDIDGDYGWELSGPCVASDAGGDEFWIEFGTEA